MAIITTAFNWLIKNPIIIVIILLLLALGYIGIQRNTIIKERDAKEIAQSNYDAVDQGTKVFTTKLGNLATTVNALQLSNEQITSSNNKRIQELLNSNTDMGNKLNKTNTLISGLGSKVESFNTKVKHDTIIASKKYKDYEQYITKNLTLTRMLLLNSDSANYLYEYHNRLFASISTFKVGKWHFKNLFTPRKVDNKLTITSDDKNYKIDSLILIKVK